MRGYFANGNWDDLDEWPSLVDSPRHKILRGEPRAFGRVDHGGLSQTQTVGIWQCTQGAFEAVELGDELQTIVEGRLGIVEGDGTRHEFGPGDSFFTRKGEVLVWDVIERVTKVFFTNDVAGSPTP